MPDQKRFNVSLLNKEHLLALKEITENNADLPIARIYLNADLAFDEEILSICRSVKELVPKAEWILELPKILRKGDTAYLERVSNLTNGSSMFQGVLIGNLEAAGFFDEKSSQIKLYGDHNLYLWNSKAVEEWGNLLSGGCLPLELRREELQEMLKMSFLWEKVVYGRIPMMVTANCVAKTNGNCPAPPNESFKLRDRMGKDFPVCRNCTHCYNVIYNSLPLSLHGSLSKYADDILLRIALTTEGKREAVQVLSYFLLGLWERNVPFSGEYTTGHEKRGAL